MLKAVALVRAVYRQYKIALDTGLPLAEEMRSIDEACLTHKQAREALHRANVELQAALLAVRTERV
jgi:hypothetical protein